MGSKPLTLFAILTLTLTTHIVHLPQESLVVQALLNIGHLPLFTLITIFILHFFGLTPFNDKTNRYVLPVILTLTIAILLELLQIPTSRDADIGDLLRDIGGIIVGIVLHKAYSLPQPAKKIRLYGTAMIVFCLFTVSQWYSAFNTYTRQIHFPILADFELPLDKSVLCDHGSTLTRIPTPTFWVDNHSSYCGLIEPDTTVEQSGLRYSPIGQNWSGYSNLIIDLYIPAESVPNRLVVKIYDDSHSGEYTDRFTRFIPAHTGALTLRIPLEDIFTAPLSRRMNESGIAQVLFFTDDISWKGPLYIDAIRLE